MSFLFVDVENEDSFHYIQFNKKFEKDNTQRIDGIFVGLPRSLFFAKKIDLPPLSYDSIYEALTYRLPKLFYFIKKPFFVFYPLKKDLSKVIVLVCEKDKIESILNTIEKKFNAKVVGVFVTSLAISDYLINKQYTEFSFILKRDSGYETLIFLNGFLKDFYFFDTQKKFENISISTNNHFLFSWDEFDPDSNIKIDKDILSYIFTCIKNKKSSFWFKNIFPERVKFLKKESLLHKFSISIFILSLFFLSISPVIKMYMDVSRLDKEVNRLKPEVKKIKKLDLEINNKIEDIEKFISYFKVRKLDLLYNISKEIPEDADITYVSINRDVIRIRGYYKKATEIINRLNQLDLFSEVKLIGPILKTKRYGNEVETFDVEIRVKKWK